MKRFLKKCGYAMGLYEGYIDESGFNIDVRALEFRKHFQRAFAYLTRDENVNSKIIHAAIDSFKDQEYFIYTIKTIWLALHQLTEEQKEECTELGARLMKKQMAKWENDRLDKLFAKLGKEYADTLGDSSPVKDMILKAEDEINAARSPDIETIDPGYGSNGRIIGPLSYMGYEKYEANPQVLNKEELEKLNKPEFKTEYISVPSSPPPEPSPVLNKEELEALAAKKAPAKEQEEADRQTKLDEAFFSKSVGNLPWISVEKSMPEFTKEDYLNQDSFCLLRHTDLELCVGLYCPILGLFRDLDAIFYDNKENYDDLPADNCSYEFHDQEKITHWVKISEESQGPLMCVPTIFHNADEPMNLNDKQKEELAAAWEGQEIKMPALQYNKESCTPHSFTIDLPINFHSTLVNPEPGIIFLVKPKDEVNLDDLPWIPISERTPNYTFEQFRIEESKVLVKTEDGIEMALFSPNTRAFYQTIDSEPYPMYAVTEWFPISTESV